MNAPTLPRSKVLPRLRRGGKAALLLAALLLCLHVYNVASIASMSGPLQLDFLADVRNSLLVLGGLLAALLAAI